MTAQKKAKKKQTKLEQATRNKMTPKKKLAIEGHILKKQPANRTAPNEVAAKAVGKKSKSTHQRPIRGRSQTEETAAFSPKGTAARSAGQSGDLQGLSNVETADSESVVELLEEGNAFEAAVVAGVQSAGNTDPSEVRTHEVPEDDVPDEYLDRD